MDSVGNSAGNSVGNSAGSNTVYVTRQGATVAMKDRRLRVTLPASTRGKEPEDGGPAEMNLPLEHVAQIVAVGCVHLTAPLVMHCLRAGIDVCYLSSHGSYLGRLTGEGSRDVTLRAAQFATCLDPVFALPVVRALVAGKLANQAALLRRRREVGGAEAAEAAMTLAAARIDAYREAARRHADDLEALRGVEGSAAAIYFPALARLLEAGPGDVPFSGQRERPAADGGNALLNLGYTLLYQNVLGALHRVGLDPYLGCFHQPRRGHAALASDLMEEFRAPVVDSLVVALANRREIAARDFSAPKTRRSAGDGGESGDGGVRLSPDALRRFLTRFDTRMETRIYHAPARGRFTYRQLLEMQARQFARVVRGESVRYTPYHWDY